MASTYLTRTFGSATSRTKFTISVWLKKSTINSDDNNEKHFFALESDAGGFTPRGFSFDTSEKEFKTIKKF